MLENLLPKQVFNNSTWNYFKKKRTRRSRNEIVRKQMEKSKMEWYKKDVAKGIDMCSHNFHSNFNSEFNFVYVHELEF